MLGVGDGERYGQDSGQDQKGRAQRILVVMRQFYVMIAAVGV